MYIPFHKVLQRQPFKMSTYGLVCPNNAPASAPGGGEVIIAAGSPGFKF